MMVLTRFVLKELLFAGFVASAFLGFAACSSSSPDSRATSGSGGATSGSGGATSGSGGATSGSGGATSGSAGAPLVRGGATTGGTGEARAGAGGAVSSGGAAGAGGAGGATDAQPEAGAGGTDAAGGASSGVPVSKILSSLTDEEKAALCRWWEATLGLQADDSGLYDASATYKECPGDKSVSLWYSPDSCRLALGQTFPKLCEELTVASFESCMVAAKSDVCLFATAPECELYSGCFQSGL